MTKIDSNLTKLSYAEETSLKVLPGSPVFYGIEPNSYSDFGGAITTISRETINPSRQRKKGTTTDLEASAGFNVDFTQNNLTSLMQGFMFADAYEKVGTKNLNDTAITITGVTTGASETYTAASGLDAFAEGSLVVAEGFSEGANNGLKTVTASASGVLTVAETLVAEASPSADAKLTTCGFGFGSGDLTMTADSEKVTLTTASEDFTTMGLSVGEWIFIGGDDSTNNFSTALSGYGRIKSVSASSLVLDETTFTAATDSGSGKSVQIFFGKYIKNEAGISTIKRRTYTFERQLGNDGNGVQTELIKGSVPSEFSVSFASADKVACDVSFVSMDSEYRTGTQGPISATRIDSLDEDAFNTSTDVYRTHLAVVDGTLNNPDLNGFISDASVSINNNIERLNAVGVLGAFEASTGNFDVSGSIEAYFSTVEAQNKIRANADIEYNIILAHQNEGTVIDLPLISLSDGKPNVDLNAPIKLPLEQSAAENENGYTMSFTSFQYLPTIAMPSI